MARVKVEAYLDVDESVVDREHESGLTQQGFEQVHAMLRGFDDVETSLAEED